MLLRTQIRALLRATAGEELRLLLPMVTTVGEVDMARALVDRELKLMRRRGAPDPTRVLLGAMIEVPSLLFELDALLPRVDFVSVGSNDLLQYLFAADRNNARVSTRYDALSAAPLRALAAIVDAAKRHNRPLSLCGEMAGRPLEAMALIALGYRSISMAPASVGPVKSMILSLDAGAIERWMAGQYPQRRGQPACPPQAVRRGTGRGNLGICLGDASDTYFYCCRGLVVVCRRGVARVSSCV